MFHHAYVLILLQSTLVCSIFEGTTKTRGEYGIIHREMEYFPSDDNGFLGDMNEMPSMHQCAHQCMFNELCRAATYYEDLKSCRLFSVGSSQGIMNSRAKTKVIDFVDRMLPGKWYSTEQMTSARDFHKSTFVNVMNSVQIVGGSDGSTDLSSTETFFVSNGSFERRGDTLMIRRFHTVDCLNGHLIVVAGGWSALGTAELYDPILGVTNSTVFLSAPRAEHASAVINGDGVFTKKLLLVGGLDVTGKLDTGDVFHMTAGLFSPVSNNMSSRRCYHTATPIGNGYVLVAGGIDNSSVELDTLELYNSSSNEFVPLSACMSTSRAYHSATYIPSIQAVLFVGGRSAGMSQNSYDLFDVSTCNFTVLNGTTLYPRAYHTATLLSDHRVLIAGGQDDVERLSSCELYDPVVKTFTATANMSMERADHTATLLPDTGQVLVCGGQTTNYTVIRSCELYQPRFADLSVSVS